MLLGNLFKYWTYQVFAPGTVLKEKYAAFKSLLAHDKRAHELIAELEEIYYHRGKRDYSAVVKLCDELSGHVRDIVDDLSRVCPGRYPDLALFYRKTDAYLRYMTAPAGVTTDPPYVSGLDDITPDAPHLVGGKALNLGILRNELQLRVPDGFVITVNAFHHFLEASGLRVRIDRRLADLDIHDTAALDAVSTQIQDDIRGAALPGKVADEMKRRCRELTGQSADHPRLAVRSSAVGEDSDASFAGQYRTLLNVAPGDLEAAYREVIAGKYAPAALYYRINYGLTDIATPMAVLVLRMVSAASSGVLYTADVARPESTALSIHAVRGLGEQLVSGKTTADRVTVEKSPALRIISRRPAEKSAVPVCLDDDRALGLARRAVTIENHFEKPQDIEWAVDHAHKIFILQSRPLNPGAAPADAPECEFGEVTQEILLTGGERAATGIAAGRVYNLARQAPLEAVPTGAVLVARDASPEYVKVIDRLNAVVTDAGSAAGHFASVAREFGIPTLVGTRTATQALKRQQTVTVNADVRTVYAGKVDQMLASPCARPDLIIDNPFMRKLQFILKFVSPLELVDPEADNFSPQHCRSMHDIIRFAHEKAVSEMFHVSDNRLRKLSFAKKLQTDIPLNFYILDVGGGLDASAPAAGEVPIEAVANRAMLALWRGLSHPDIRWGSFRHFDWEAHDRIVMSGGIASPEATMFASHAVISRDYMNLNLKFGYHFVIVDAHYGSTTSADTILFRFSGGGGDLDQRMLRAEFLGKILQRLGFDVSIKSDLVDGQLRGMDPEACLRVLDMLGRLLGATRLMDMYLKAPEQIESFVDDFMAGRYHFASVD